MNQMNQYWAWYRGSLVTAKRDGTIPLNSKVVMFNVDGKLELPNEADSRLISNAPELLHALEIIKCFCETVEASHKDEIFLQKLKKELEPIVKECETAIAKAGGALYD